MKNIIKEENIAKQQAPLDNAIFAKTQQAALDSNNPNQDRSLLADIVTLGQCIGPQVSKYAQTTQSKVDHHIYLSSRQVKKAFTADDFGLFDKTKCQMKVINDSTFGIAYSVRIMWHIQKKCQNSQTNTLLSDSANPGLCPVIGTLRMVLRAWRLKLPNSMPLECYCTKKTLLVYMTANRMASLV